MKIIRYHVLFGVIVLLFGGLLPLLPIVSVEASAATVDQITFSQIDWFGSQASAIVDSEWGQFSVRITPSLYPEYVNVVAKTGGSDQWIVRNMPTVPITAYAYPLVVVTTFDLGLLGISRGSDISTLNYYVSIDTTPLTTAPSGTMTTASVGAVDYDAEGRSGGPLMDPGTPPDLSVLNFSFLGASVNWHSGVPNIDLDSNADVNGCGPAAQANSLKWLSDTYQGVNIGDSLQEIFDDVDADIGRGAGSPISDSEFLSGKLKYIDDEELCVTTKFKGGIGLGAGNFITPHGTATRIAGAVDFNFIEAEIEAGEDVELAMSWDTNGGHWVTVSGTIDIGFAQGVWTKDDGDQDAAGGKKTNFGWLIPKAGGGIELTGFARNEVDFVVSESPYPCPHPPPSIVGGIAMPANKIELLTPWIALALILLSIGIAASRKFRKRFTK